MFTLNSGNFYLMCIGKSMRTFKTGTLVERELEGMWFSAKIVAVDREDGTYEIEYLDDGNLESAIEAR